MPLWRFGLALLLLGCCARAAAEPAFYSLQRFGLDEGLSQNSVTSVIEDDLGFLWVGTQEGLNRFDGHQFKVYRRLAQTDDGVATSSVNALAFGLDSRLWIGTDDAGLAVRDLRGGDAVRLGVNDGLGHRTVQRLLLDGAGGAWIGGNAGVDHVSAQLGAAKRLLDSDAITALVPAEKGEALASDWRCRVWRLQRDRAVALQLAVPDEAQCIGLAQVEQQLWLVTRAHGLLRFDAAGRLLGQVPARSLREGKVEIGSFLQLRSGQFLLGYEDGVLLRFRPGHYGSEQLRFDQPLHSAIMVLHEGRDGLLWIGTGSSGLWRARALSPAVRRDLLGDDELVDWPTHSVRSVWRNEQLWLVGTDQGLLWRGAGESRWRRIEDIGVTSIRRILPAPRGGWWIGSHRGLWHLRIDGSAVPVPGLPHPQVTDLLAEGDLLWVATRGGLALLRGLVVQTDAVPAALDGVFLTALLRDGEGRLWIGSNERGLFRLRSDGELEHLHPGNRKLPHNSIWALHEDAQAWWLGTFSGGLLRIDRASGAITGIGESQGLSNDVIYRIESDARGRLWLSSNHGINVYDPANGSVQVLLPGDGLRSREFNSGASTRDHQGLLYFGGTDGLDILEPARFDGGSAPARPLLTELRVLARAGEHGEGRGERSLDIGYSDRVQLDHRDSVFALGMVGIDLASPDTAQLRYRITGLHDDWVHPEGGRAELLLSYLPAGDYRLELQAAGRDGRFGESRTLALQVLPPPWEHPLARAAYVLAGLLLLAFLVSRVGASARSKRKQIALLNRTVAERTAELERANTLLLQSNQRLELATRTDPLTQVSNRRDLQDWLQREGEALLQAVRAGQSTPLLFVMLDIDDFKRINDSHGHPAGDAVLVEFARRLRALCRERDVAVRWGGEEFLLLLRDSHPGDAAHLAERLRRTIADTPITLPDGSALPITCSIGFAPWPMSAILSAASDWEQSVALADRALYAAKGAGKNAWVGLLPGTALTAHSLQQLLAGATPQALPPDSVFLLHSTATAPELPVL
ncbi:MAG TPA: diguanylate cyclase [Arenimonas sp.]|nr:diguanylate cyclase [Arenimonas sp.]